MFFFKCSLSLCRDNFLLESLLLDFRKGWALWGPLASLFLTHRLPSALVILHIFFFFPPATMYCTLMVLQNSDRKQSKGKRHRCIPPSERLKLAFDGYNQFFLKQFRGTEKGWLHETPKLHLEGCII